MVVRIKNMKIRELIQKLNEYNQEADISVIAHCKEYPFTLSFGGGGEGETKDKTNSVHLYVDELCTNERQNS